MTLDQYQHCPCGSGKKIKFCCSKELAADLDRIQRMIQGDQRLAALEKIEALLEKHPDCPSLLMLRADIELQLREPEKAKATVEKLVQVNSENPSVAAMMSLLAGLTEGNISAGIHYLQEAFNRADGQIPGRVYEAIVTISQLLQRVGYAAAAKGHLQLALALSNAEDERSAQALMQLNHARQIPLVLREPLTLMAAPTGVTWRIEFDATMREIFRGRWRRGAEQLSMMAIRILDEPSILYNQAVVYAWLADNAKAIKALQDFARIRDVPLDDRVHALALVEYLETDKDVSSVEVVEATYEVDDFEGLMERCLAHDHMNQIELDANAQMGEGQPLPRALFDVLDRPDPKDTKDLKVDDIPASQGVIVLFGKETDRAARVVLQAPRTRLEKLVEFCSPLVGGEMGDVKDEKVVSRVPWLACEVFGEWRIPRTASPDDRQRLSVELREQAVEQRWPVTAMPNLDGKTPTEAASEGNKYQAILLASILNLELQAEDTQWDHDFNALRKKLNLPTREPIDANTVDLERLPVHRLSLIDAKVLDDEQLLTVYRRAYAVMAVHPLRSIALEVISRETLDERIDKVEAYDILSDVATNTDEALSYLDKARKLATADGESPAAWLIDELEIRLLRGEADKFVHLLKEIQTRYIKEPGIAPALVETLSRYGLVTPDGRLMMPVANDGNELQPTGAEANTGGVWTPEAGSAGTDSGGEGKSESKLWVPD